MLLLWVYLLRYLVCRIYLHVGWFVHFSVLSVLRLGCVGGIFFIVSIVRISVHICGFNLVAVFLMILLRTLVQWYGCTVMVHVLFIHFQRQ